MMQKKCVFILSFLALFSVTPIFPGFSETTQGQANANPNAEYEEYLTRLHDAERMVAEVKARRGENHPDFATVMTNLAVLYQVQGEYEKAAVLFQKAFTLREKLFGKQNPQVVESIYHLAFIAQMQNQDRKAESLYLEGIQRIKTMPMAERLDATPFYEGLASIYYFQNNFGKAKFYLNRELRIRTEKFGPKHPKVASVLDSLAGIYHVQKNYLKAEMLYVRALKIKRKTLAPADPDLAYTLNNLAGVYQSQKRYKQAEAFFKQALEIDKKSLGENHPDVALDLKNLGIIYQAQAKYPEARECFQKALKIKEETSDSDDADVIAIKESLKQLTSK